MRTLPSIRSRRTLVTRAPLKSPPSRRRKRCPFKVYSPQALAALQTSDSAAVQAIVGCSPAQAALLLKFCKWDLAKTLERFCDDPSRVCRDSGAVLDPAKQPQFLALPEFECTICYDSDPELTIGLSCGHRYCTSCYTHSLEEKIQQGQSAKLKCPDPSCTLTIDDSLIESLVSPTAFSQYKKSNTEEFLVLRGRGTMIWCPQPGCESAIEYKSWKQLDLDLVVPTVSCSCGYHFCFSCKQGDHRPTPCKLLKVWAQKKEEDMATKNWIEANTKECPQCNAAIEKNGGCNHMTCRKCTHEFCWICLGKWAGHSCARYSATTGARRTESVAGIEEYLHYLTRYANHEKSAILDKELSERIELSIQSLQDNASCSWIDVQFLAVARETLVTSRQTLKWTYCFAYFLENNNAKSLFEDNQRYLELAVESLSQLLQHEFERDDSQLKGKIVDKSCYVSQRREMLLENAANDLREGALKWKQL
ncbi:hypothetical protein BDR26DRAFT_799199 [Obelidium mucronatum]|nr:hypothetical protein BDR26DRAFT_799199 [Obelidium mucronatum]